MTDPDPSRWLVESEQARARELQGAARVLHDEVCQILTAVALEIDMLALDHPELSDSLTGLRPKLEAAFTGVRGLAWDLNPELVSKVGLYSALERLAERYGCRWAGASPAGLTQESAGFTRAQAGFTPAQAGAIYRIVGCLLDQAASKGETAGIVIQVNSGPPAAAEIRIPGPGAAQLSSYAADLIDHLAGENGLKNLVHPVTEKGTMFQILSDIGANRDAL